MIFDVEDIAENAILINKIKSLIELNEIETSTIKKIESMSYEERRKEFFSCFGIDLKGALIGNLSWYKGFDKKGYECNKLPVSLQFHGADLRRYFNDGEELPCIMRGSMKALHGRQYQRAHSVNLCYVSDRVMERYLRVIKFTCLSREDMLSYKQSGWYQIICTRISDKHGFSPSVSLFSYSENNQYNLWVAGKQVCVTEKEIEAMKSLNSVIKKIDKVKVQKNDRRRTKSITQTTRAIACRGC